MKRLISIIFLVNVFLLTIIQVGYCSDWTQVGADIDGEAVDDRSGWFVSLSSDGSIIAIGDPYNDGNGTYSGHVRVYKNVSGTWTQMGQDIDGEVANDNSGRSVCLSADGSIVAIGANQNSGNGTYAGHVRIYKWDGTVWNQVGADIDGEGASEYSGWIVSLSADGSVVAIGAHFNYGINGENSGHVRVYKNISNTWTQVGSDIDGEAVNDLSGYSVSLNSDGTIVAVGAYANDGVNGSDSGHVRVYKNVSNTWTQVGSDIDGEAANDFSGRSVSLSADGSVVAIGADVEVGSYSGHVKVYKWNGSSWNQRGDNIDGEAASDLSGRSVSLSADGSIVAIGALGNDGLNGSNSGHVRIYKWNGSSWNKLGSDIDGEAADDNSGYSVSLSANGLILAIGAPYNDGVNGTNSGHSRVFEIEIEKFPWTMFLPAITISAKH